VEWTRDGYTISDDRERVDREAVHRYLAQESYWAAGIEREVLDRALDGSLCFGLYAPDGGPAGFARVVTDRATYGYLADVFVLAEHRGRGLGAWLVEVAVGHPELATLRRWVLFTADAHELYVRFGFGPAATPETYMERRREGGPAGG
jgi:GNAT superfamily N-acetyltransferase